MFIFVIIDVIIIVIVIIIIIITVQDVVFLRSFSKCQILSSIRKKQIFKLKLFSYNLFLCYSRLERYSLCNH